jgi:hypothetical protein
MFLSLSHQTLKVFSAKQDFEFAGSSCPNTFSIAKETFRVLE